jgi:hypothetical protein
MKLVPVRFPPNVIDLLDKEKERMAASNPGWNPKRCDAVRRLVQVAVECQVKHGKR